MKPKNILKPIKRLPVDVQSRRRIDAPLHVRQPQEAPKTLWLVAPPKTGSTWLSELLKLCLRWPTMQIIPAGFARREQEILVPQEYMSARSHVFLPHHHSKASEPTISFVKEFNVKVVILTRNVYDTVVSLIDHLTQDGVGIPNAYIPMSFRDEPFDRRAEIVIRCVLPWYISFYASWAYAEAEHQIHPLYVAYEQLLTQPVKVLSRCLTHIHEVRNINVYNRALLECQKVKTRFNKGFAGRGSMLSNAHHAAIDEIINAHTDTVIRTALERIMHVYPVQSDLQGSNGEDITPAEEDTSTVKGASIRASSEAAPASPSDTIKTQT